ncbi:hypothetical protein CBS147325_1415 [Penicillium roqueforti]|nr:hypothetical protein CBS147325_1415 [Penicillium roqueforti]
MEAKHGYKLVVGVDYGTTFTEIAYVLTTHAGGQADIDSIDFIKQWPPDIIGQAKTPSLISYMQDGGAPLWGFEVTQDVRSYAWTKLLLDANFPSSSKFDDTFLKIATASKILELPDQKEAVDTVQDYLSQIYTHIQSYISAELGLSGVPIDFWFTTPASWSEDTQNLMRQAIQGAGFGKRPQHRVWTIPEPEAAALAVFSDKRVSFKPRDGILICDCGGGTVDITTYYVTDVDPTISLEQITTVMGANCGGTAIDSRFYELLSTRVEGGFDSLSLSEIRPGSRAMKKFERIKTHFNGATSQSWHFDFNLNSQSPSQRRGRVVLQAEDVRDLYEPVLRNIFDLILSQITAANEKCGRHVIKKVVLVGGFSASSYLQESLGSALNRIGISVLIPENPEEAIARGAAVQGLRGYSLPTYKCWRNYGLASFQSFSHPNEPQFLGYGPSALSVNLLPCWVLRKDQNYPKGFQSTHSIQVLHWEHDLLTKPVEIYESNLSDAPERFENSDAHCIDYIQCHFDHLDFASFPHRTIAGHTVYYLELLIQASVSMTDRVIHFSAFANGNVIGQKDLVMAHD